MSLGKQRRHLRLNQQTAVALVTSLKVVVDEDEHLTCLRGQVHETYARDLRTRTAARDWLRARANLLALVSIKTIKVLNAVRNELSEAEMTSAK